MAACLFATCFAQDYKKNPAFGISYVLFDFKSANDIRTSGLATVIKNRQLGRIRSMGTGFGVNYYEGLSDHIDFAGSLAGSFLKYPVPNKPEDATDEFLLDANATANLKLTTDRYWVSPFITAGLGASKYKGYYGAYIPLGVGIQVNLWDKTYFFFNSQYRVALTETASYHLYHGFGIATNLYKKKAK